MTTKKTTTKVYSKNQANTRNILFIVVFVGVIILGAAFVLLNNNQQPQAAAVNGADAALLGQVQTFPILSRDHIQPGQTHPPYNSNPPTNGWHYPVWADWGIYTQTIPDEYLVHNLEHGGIWISYRSAISLAAWGVLLNLDHFDAATIKAFIATYRFHGPENIDGNAS